MQVDKKEALRYMGVRGEPDAQTLALIGDCIPRLTGVAAFKYTALELPVTIEDDAVSFSGITVKSRALARHIAGSAHVLLFAATLGAGVDRLMQAYAATDIPRAAALQACAASLLENAADEAQAGCEKEYAEKGLYLRPRFSPGYGDFSLAVQPDILRLLDAQKRIGLFATKNIMLTPTKSITAVIGVSSQPCAAKPGCAGGNKNGTARFARKQTVDSIFWGLCPQSPTPRGHVPWESLYFATALDRAVAGVGSKGRYGPWRRFGGRASNVPITTN